MNDQLIADIQHARFTPVRLAQGYDMGEVDRFLDELVAALSSGSPVDPLVDGARFSSTRMREGYDMADVDRLLSRVRAEAGTGPTPPRSASSVAAGQEPQPTAVQEQRGLLSRLFGRAGRR